MTVVPVKSADLDAAEISWFAPICGDDYRYMGVEDGALRPTWDHTADIVRTADRLGYRNILCPSSYQVGQDTWSFVSAMAPLTEQINMLAAIRCGEIHPAMLARAVSTVDHIMKGRLTLNVISSPFPGEEATSELRYKRSTEVVEILRQAWTRDEINYDGEIYQLKGLSTDPVRPYQQNGGPLLYFGGYAPDALELCGRFCDVYLMWPEPEDLIEKRMRDVHARAKAHGRVIDYGLRVHVIVRDTENEAREYADELMSKLDDDKGTEIRNRALDAKTYGVSLQAANREKAGDDGFVEPHLWTGIGRARSGCGAALVGSVDQVLSKIERYRKMGIRAFIFSGYPHKDECEVFGAKVLSQLKTCSMPDVYGRVPSGIPATPLGAGVRR